MSAPRDAERVLADVLAELDRLIRQTEAGVTFWEKQVGGDVTELTPPVANLHAARTSLDLLLAVRRAARGGRDGGGE